MKFPEYRESAVDIRQRDFEILANASSIEDLSLKVYKMSLTDVTSEHGISGFIRSESFREGASFEDNEDFCNSLKTIVARLYSKAAEYGFPEKPGDKTNTSQIDFELAGILFESLEEFGFDLSPALINSKLMKSFMAARVLPLLVYWRWSVIQGKRISSGRFGYDSRNYFQILWLSGWLFDKGQNYQDSRWDLLKEMSADSLVQVVERPGIGLRRGFARAVAEERALRKNNLSGTMVDLLTRGVMKRATFTFSTAVMLDNEDYYRAICKYLFNWAEKNYMPFLEKSNAHEEAKAQKEQGINKKYPADNEPSIVREDEIINTIANPVVARNNSTDNNPNIYIKRFSREDITRTPSISNVAAETFFKLILDNGQETFVNIKYKQKNYQVKINKRNTRDEYRIFLNHLNTKGLKYYERDIMIFKKCEDACFEIKCMGPGSPEYSSYNNVLGTINHRVLKELKS